jgi:hypothetical protein
MKESLISRQGLSAPVDWVWLELRSDSDPTLVVDERAAVVLANGQVVMADGTSPVLFTDAPRGSYHVMATHRNHLGIMTSGTHGLGNGVRVLDLSSAAVPTYGVDARRTIGPIQALWAGDVNADGVIRYTGAANDRDPILSRIGGSLPTATTNGYHPEDVNLDGVVRYTGAANDRDPILQTVGGSVPTNTREEQLP